MYANIDVEPETLIDCGYCSEPVDRDSHATIRHPDGPLLHGFACLAGYEANRETVDDLPFDNEAPELTDDERLVAEGKLCATCGATREATLRRDDPGCIVGEAATGAGTELILGGIHKFANEADCGTCQHPETHHVFLEEDCQVADCDCTKFKAAA